MYARVIPIVPEIVSGSVPTGEDALGVVWFGDPPAASGALNVPMRQLGGAPRAEVWRSSLPVTGGRVGEVIVASNDAVLFGSMTANHENTEAVTGRVYAEIVSVARAMGYPNLLRVWNYLGGINGIERDQERYKRFCAGRHEALTRLGFAPRDFPAACALGMSGAGLTVYFLASKTRGAHIENPRQVPAYHYPRAYGLRSPSFARATVAQWNGNGMIFLAGTSSVVGHETAHAGDVCEQVDETLRNVAAIVSEAAARTGRNAGLEALVVAKTYIRHAQDYERVAARVTAALPNAQHMFIEGQICRHDLLVEIEGTACIAA